MELVPGFVQLLQPLASTMTAPTFDPELFTRSVSDGVDQRVQEPSIGVASMRAQNPLSPVGSVAL